ncbi:septation protein A [Pararobbsia silviterrae]|uniref:Inner membrane-spanning protein YciB n=1 Tax=Pararobbsia silviterrae TaxID=1792498 RepID=A0A494Y339_9BURK|nr:septation protein A [Pararobbsia silviterrae]RKP54752.1 septation protein A [Pararobbsia silviterrae]
MKLLFDFFPIILFFVAYKLTNIYTATAIAIVASLALIGWVAFRHRKVDPLQWVSLIVIVVLGGATLVLHDDVFIKWKPTVAYWLFAIALGVSRFGFGKDLLKTTMGKELVLPEPVWTQLTIAWVAFFALLGVVNLVILYHFSTDVWVNFKLFGGIGCMVVFIIAQSFWLARYLKEE